MPEVLRFDVARMGRVEKMHDGGIRVPAYATRVGVFTYTRGDGSKVRELRLPEEVFAEDTMRSLRGVSVTDLHPPELISPSNFRRYTVGHVADNVRQTDDGFVSASLVIHDEAAIAAVMRGDRAELSCGYRCTVDATPGTHAEYGEYDAIQRGIRHNHVAIGPQGWGRAGPEARMHLDAADAIEWCEPGDGAAARDDAAGDAGADMETDMPDAIKTKAVRVDGVDYQVAEHEAPHLERAIHAIAKRADDAEARATKATAERDALQGKLDGVTTERDALRAEAAPEKIAAKARERAALETTAKRVLGEDAKLDGLTDREIKVRAIAKANPQAKLNEKSDDYVGGAFEALVETLRQDGRERASTAANEPMGEPAKGRLSKAIAGDQERLDKAAGKVN